jgi:hypothetical protein
MTQSLVMRSASGTVRWIDAKHDFSRLRKLAGTRYEGGPAPSGDRNAPTGATSVGN